MSEPTAERSEPRGSSTARTPLAAALGDFAALALLLCSPLIPTPYAGLSIAVALAIWLLLRRPPLRELVAIALCASAAAAFLIRDQRDAAADSNFEQRIRFAAEQEYQDLLLSLRTEAEEAATELTALANQDDQVVLFEMLRRRAETSKSSSTTLLLLDSDSRPVAWAGPGLRHDVTIENIPDSGIHGIASFLSVSLLAIEPVPVEAGTETRRLVAGRSYDTSAIPFVLPTAEANRFRFTLADAAFGQERKDNWLLVRSDLGPSLVLVLPQGSGRSQRPGRELAALLLTTGVLILVGLRLVMPIIARGAADLSLIGRYPSRLGTSLIALLALIVLAVFYEALRPGLMLLAVSLALALAIVGVQGLRNPTVVSDTGGDRSELSVLLSTLPLAVVHTLALATLFAAFLNHPALIQPSVGGSGSLSVLSPQLLAPAASIPVRLSIPLLVLLPALFFLPRSARPREPEQARLKDLGWGLLCLSASSLAAFSMERRTMAFALCITAMAAFLRWARTNVWGLGRLASLLLLATTVGASLWSVVERESLVQYLAGQPLIEASNSRSVMKPVAAELELFLDGFDLSELAVGNPSRVQQRLDLALAIWLRSPLNRPSLRSALAVLPKSGGLSTFSFGLSLDEQTGQPVEVEERVRLEWQSGSKPVRIANQDWGELRYWFASIPGAPTTSSQRSGSLEEELLTGRASYGEIDRLVQRPAEIAVYRAGVLQAATTSAPERLPPELAAGADRVTTKIRDATALAWSRSSNEDETTVLFIPELGAIAGFWQVANLVIGIVLILLGGATLVLLVGLPGPAFQRALRLNLRSYSTRLLIVFTLLVLLPLALLNLVLFRTLDARSAALQQDEGETALRAARRLVEQRVTQLETGRSIDTALDDSFLIELSRVVQHQTNVYWRGSVLASSSPELFAAGLLARRIPGSVYSQLVLEGRSVASRTNQLNNGTSYLELYGAIPLPGERPEEARLFVSVPLLAQQAEARDELNDLRRRVLVVTSSLFLALAFVGSWLARSFSAPVMSLVRGTQRIAAGEARLGFTPKDRELEALAAAIDDMADKVAKARIHLLQEKRALEGVVDNITAGVVAFDEEGRVSMVNRVAGESFGIKPGMSFGEVSRLEAFHNASDFLERARRHSQASRTTLVLPRNEQRKGGEWSLVWAPVAGDGDPAALMVVEDVSEVLRAQRLDAWAEMARMIAHEIKNPLTPIRLSTEHLQQIYRRAPERLGEVFDRCTNNILEQVQELQDTAADFSAYSRIPEAEIEASDLTATLRAVVDPYVHSAPKGLEVSLRTPEGPVMVAHDSKLIRRALRNLVENAVRACDGGGRVEVTLSLPPDLIDDDGEASGRVRLQVRDTGTGVPEQDLDRIFEPYFSTSTGGTGLGLPITRRVVEEHEGTIEARNLPSGGLEVTLELPLSPTAASAPLSDSLKRDS